MISKDIDLVAISAVEKVEHYDVDLAIDIICLIGSNCEKVNLVKERLVAKKKRAEQGRLSLNDKIKRRMITDRNFLYTKCADKYQVREYVAKRIGSAYLVPLIACIEDPNQLKYFDLKDCVVKPNHGASMVEIIGENGLTDQERHILVLKAKSWLRIKYGSQDGEWHYLNILPKILIEKSICIDGKPPSDYKFHMFKQLDGTFKYVLQVIRERQESSQHSFYLNDLDNCVQGDDALDSTIKKKLNKCIFLSELLMDNFDYARVDWYVAGDKIYFGEITFTPGCGNSKAANPRLQEIMGALWIY